MYKYKNKNAKYKNKGKVKSKYSKIKKGYKKKAKVNATYKMVSFYPSGTNSPLPPRYRCKFITNVYGYTSLGVGSGAYSFAVKLNSPRLPMASGFLGTGITWVNIATGTLNPTGLTTLLNANYYTRYRVYSSQCAIDLIPQSIQDSVVATVSPILNNVFATTADAIKQPFTKSYDFVNARNPPSKYGLKNYITQHGFVGVRKQAIEDDLSQSYVGYYNADPQNLLLWNITMSTIDNTILNNALELRLRLVHYVELFGIVTESMATI